MYPDKDSQSVFSKIHINAGNRVKIENKNHRTSMKLKLREKLACQCGALGIDREPVSAATAFVEDSLPFVCGAQLLRPEEHLRMLALGTLL